MIGQNGKGSNVACACSYFATTSIIGINLKVNFFIVSITVEWNSSKMEVRNKKKLFGNEFASKVNAITN